MERKDSENGRKKNVTGEGSVNVNKDEKVSGGPVSGGTGGKKNGSSQTSKPAGTNDPDKGLVGDLASSALSGLVSNAAGNLLNNVTSGSSSSSKKSSGGLGKILRLILIVVAIILVWKFLQNSGCLGGGGGYIGYESNYKDESYYHNDSQPSQNSQSSQESYNITPTVTDTKRDYYTTVKGNKQDTVTIMIYMCGTDLESQYGLATADLVEITKAASSDKVNIIVQTGGCQKWQNNIFSNKTTQRYKVNSEGVTKLQDLGKQLQMTKASTLTDFIQYCKTNFSANRYMLIFWDHGGGSVSGYGYDQNYQSAGSMTIDQIDKALSDAGVKFDFIGFDACLMATYETAVVAERHADYLIASEEPEPGYGWYYTDWIDMLAKNSSAATEKVAANIVDTYISHCKSDSPGSAATLSVIDLKKMIGSVPSKFNAFSQSLEKMMENNNYQTISSARANAKEFSPSNRLDQVDLIHFLDKLGTSEASALSKALKGCIVYNKANESNANGVSIYFPYKNTAYSGKMASINSNIGLDGTFTKAMRSFASALTGGQIVSSSSGNAWNSLSGSGSSASSGDISGIFDSFFGSGSSSSSSGGLGSMLDLFGSSYGSSSQNYSYSSNDDLLSSLMGSSSTSSYGSLFSGLFGGSSASSAGSGSDLTGSLLSSLFGSEQRSMMRSMTDYYAENYLDASHMSATYKNGTPVLELTDKEWDLVNAVALNLFIKDNGGYIDLGIDNYYSFDKDGDLLLEGGDTWLGLNGQVCAYYFDSYDEETKATVGFVPVLWNNQRAQLFFKTDKNGSSTFIGLRFIYENETATVAKDMFQIGQTDLEGNDILAKGSTIKLICDYYDKNGSFESSYTMGTPITFNGTLSLTDLRLNLSAGQTVSVTYRLTDIYNNNFWTEAVEP